MRQNTKVVLYILVFAFGGLWVLMDSGGLDTLGQTVVGNTVATVNGEEISYDQYMRSVEQYLQQYRARTGDTVPPEVEDMYRQRAFDMLVSNKLREQAMDRLDVEVSRTEIVEMVLGENPDPFIRRQFSDEEGNINRALLQSVIDNPAMQQDWLRIEEYLRAKRRQQKLSGLISSSVRITEQDIINEYIQRNKSVDARYVALPYAAVPNDSVTVTESDLRAYYEAHQEEFEQPRTYTIQYVAYSKQPTAQDTTRILETLTGFREDFATAENDSLFLLRHGSTTPYADVFMSRNELDPALAQALYSDLTPGRVVGPIIAGDEAHLTKILDVRTAEEPSIHVRHILIQAPQNDEAAMEQARERAQELKQQLQQGAEFAALARQYSDDPGSAAEGGDLGWIAKGTMVQSFSEAAFDAPVGEVVGPIETRFGYHLIKVLGRTNKEVKIADLTWDIEPDISTITAIENDALDLQYFASESGNFVQEAQNQNKEVQQVQVQADMNRIPGLGPSARLMAFLEQAEEGAISDVIELNDRFIVAHVSSIQEAGYRPFEEVRSVIEPRVLLQKKKEYQRQRVLEAYETHSFEELAGALGTTVQTASTLTLTQPVVPGLGQAPKFVGTTFGMEEGEVSSVVAGENAVFVAKVTAVNEPNLEQLTAAQKQAIRENLRQQRLRQVQSRWMASLREEAQIEDNRGAFLRLQ